MKKILTLFCVLFSAMSIVVAAPVNNPAAEEVDTLGARSIDMVDVVARMPKQHYGLRQQAIQGLAQKRCRIVYRNNY